jgi:glycogen operon protein
MADAMHARGMELVIDVVYNHSAETDELGPTLSLRGIDNALYYHLRPDDRALYENWTGTGNCLNLGEPRVLQLVMDSLRFWACEMGVDGFRFDLAPVLARDARARLRPARALLRRHRARPGAVAHAADRRALGHRPRRLPAGRIPAGLARMERPLPRHAARLLAAAGARRQGRLGDFAHRFTASSTQFAHHGRAPTASVNFVTAHDGFTLRDLVSYNERHNQANGENNRDGHGHNLSNNCGVEGPSDDPAVRRCAPACSARCSPRCCCRRARRCCWPATSSATASRATTTPIARTTRPPGSPGPARRLRPRRAR